MRILAGFLGILYYSFFKPVCPLKIQECNFITLAFFDTFTRIFSQIFTRINEHLFIFTQFADHVKIHANDIYIYVVC